MSCFGQGGLCSQSALVSVTMCQYLSMQNWVSARPNFSLANLAKGSNFFLAK